MIAPFWRDERFSLTIYCSDCREVMAQLEDRFHLCLTDPPYNRDVAYSAHDDSLPQDAYEEWSREWFNAARAIADTIVFSCGMQNIGLWTRIEQPTWWLAWDTVNRLMKRTPLGYNRWEPVAVYGTAPRAIPDIFHAPIISEDNPAEHPCPKPVSWAQWLVSRFSETGWSVIDPFMGTGPVLRACLSQGRACVGIDSSEAYCEATARRLEKEMQQLPLFLEAVNEARQEAMKFDEVIA